MKQSFTLLIMFLIIQPTFSQTSDFILTFEDTSVINRVYYTDSTLDPAGIWQIGRPQKSFMNTAATQPNAIVTLLDSLLPAGIKASFIITLQNAQLNNYQGGLLTFTHRYEFDPLHGGGYVEFSLDTGKHWHSIYPSGTLQYCIFGQQIWIDSQYIVPPTWWDTVPRNINSDGIGYYTGTDSAWIYDSIGFPAYLLADKTSQFTTYMFRFTVFTDSVSAALGGWLIDNIKYSSYEVVCGGGINEINSSHLSIRPNPAERTFIVSLIDKVDNDYQVTLYDLTGREIFHKNFTGRDLTLHRDGLSSGSYIIKVTNLSTQDTFEKRVGFD